MDQEQLVLKVVPMPDELALKLGALHVLAVEFPHDVGIPMGGDGFKHL
jgi:hypothetical protein